MWTKQRKSNFGTKLRQEDEIVMKALAINSSPNKGKGNTALILKPFLEGMKEAGAEVELYHTSDLKINPCQGDLSCWLRTPGECIHNDDMS
jgi:multimeric flavodoxin WrbA